MPATPLHRRSRDRNRSTASSPPHPTVGGKTYDYFSLPEAEKNGLAGISRLPRLAEGAAGEPAALRGRPHGHRRRHQGDRRTGSTTRTREHEIAFRPARVLMQDFTGVPAVVDLAAMRDAMAALGGDPQKINPLVPVDLVIDHSVMVDSFGTPRAFAQNVELEYERNGERYDFLRWGQAAFDNFRVVPPGTGICHQVNLEYLAQTVWTERGRRRDRSPIPTRWSAPTATPPWSTASPCSAGASAASRPRRRCSASRSPC